MSGLQQNLWDRWLMMTGKTWFDVSSVYKSIGVESLDQEHLLMIDYVLELNRMIDTMDKNSFDLDFIYQVAEMVERLHQQAGEHFEEEENFMRQYGLPGFKVHKEKHHKILHGMEVLIEDLSEGRFTVSLDLKIQILEWTLGHMYDEDYVIFSAQNYANALRRFPAIDNVKDAIPKSGILRLDDGHRELTRAIFNIGTSRNRDDFNAKVGELMQIQKNVFQYEAQLLDYFSVPEKASHLDEHVKIYEKCQSAIDSPSPLRYHVLRQELLYDWVCHMILTDSTTLSLEKWIVNQMREDTDTGNQVGVIFNTGREQIDSDHRSIYQNLKHLRQCFIRLVHHSENNELMDEIKMLVDTLKTNLRDHTDNEMSLCDELQLEKEKDAHRREHEYMQHALEHFQLLIESNQYSVANHALMNLVTYWVRHVLFSDSPLFDKKNRERAEGEGVGGADS